MEQVVQITITEEQRKLMNTAFAVATTSVGIVTGQLKHETANHTEMLQVIWLAKHVEQLLELVELINKDKIAKMEPIFS
jgi:hypothetical protein